MIESLAKLRGRRGRTSRLPGFGSLILLIAVMAPSLLACSSLRADTVDVHMGIVGASQPLWRYVAQQRDKLLGQSGYLVSFTSYPNEAELKKAFVNKEIDVMATLPPQLPALLGDGVNAQYFLPIAWMKEGYPIIVPKDSAIRTPADLADRKLSTFPSDHPGVAYWQAFFLANYGFRLTDKTSLVVSQRPEEKLVTGEADAATVDSVAWGQLKGSDAFRVVSDLATEWTKLSGSSRPLVYGGYVARRDWLDKHKKFVDDFLRANYQALQTYQKDQKAFLDAAAVYAEGNAQPIPADILQSVADYLGMSVVTPDRAYLTDADVADYDRVFQLMAKAGSLRGASVPAAGFFYLSESRPKSP